MVVGKGHNIHPHLLENVHPALRHAKGKLLVSRRSPPPGKRKLLVHHKDIRLLNLLPDPLIQNAVDSLRFVVCIKHMVGKIHVPSKQHHNLGG